MIINPYTPVFNTIVFYILIICLILIMKPKSIFKPFGTGKNETLFAFPTVCLGTGILLYLFFMIVEVLCYALNKQQAASL